MPNYTILKKSKIVIFSYLVFFNPFYSLYSQETKQMGFYDANIGTKFLLAKNKNANYLINEFIGVGFSGKLQGSILRAFKKDSNSIKLRFGDFISGELGVMSNVSNLIPTYRFVAGFAGIWKISPNDDLGLYWDIFSFSNDNIVSWINGGGINLKYRHKKIIGELGLFSRSGRGLSWVLPLFTDDLDPFQLQVGLRYLKGNTNWGLNAEIFPIEHYMYTNETNEVYVNVRVFYGFYF